MPPAPVSRPASRPLALHGLARAACAVLVVTAVLAGVAHAAGQGNYTLTTPTGNVRADATVNITWTSAPANDTVDHPTVQVVLERWAFDATLQLFYIFSTTLLGTVPNQGVFTWTVAGALAGTDLCRINLYGDGPIPPVFTPSPTASFTQSATASFTRSATASPTASFTRTDTMSYTASPTASATASATQTADASDTASATASYTASFTRSATASATRSATASFTRSATASFTRSATASFTRSATHTSTDTDAPTPTPTPIGRRRWAVTSEGWAYDDSTDHNADRRRMAYAASLLPPLSTTQFFSVQYSTSCQPSTTLTAQSATALTNFTVRSDTGGNNYVANQRCAWTVNANTALFLTVTFRSFAMGTVQSGPCSVNSPDYVVVRDGSSTGTIRFIGCASAAGQLNQPIAVLSSTLYILMQSGNALPATVRQNAAGFSAVVQAAPRPSITVTAPTGGRRTSYQRGTGQFVTWAFTGFMSQVSLTLLSDQFDPQAIASGVVNTGAYAWNINKTTPVADTGYQLRVAWTNYQDDPLWTAYCTLNNNACMVQGSNPGGAFGIGYCFACGDGPPSEQTTPGSTIAAIIIPILVVLLIVLIILYCVWYKRRNGDYPIIGAVAMPSLGRSSAGKSNDVPLQSTYSEASVAASSSLVSSPMPAPAAPAHVPVHVSTPAAATTAATAAAPGSKTPPPPRPAPKSAPKPNTIKVLYDYRAGNDEELSVKQGDVLVVVRQEGEWYFCKFQGREGYVPSTYVQA